jgi:SAM-dependent methyltransferase
MPRPDVLHDYYGVYYRGKEHAVTFADPPRFARHILSSVGPAAFTGSCFSILDFGGGDGTLARALAERLLDSRSQRQVEILLMDFPAPVAMSDRRIHLRHRSPFDPIEGRFDLVIASGVLEHVPDVHSLLNSLYDSVAPGGHLYARTPYGIPFTRVVRNLDLTYPAHVHDMGSPFWNRVNETFGWNARLIASRPSIVESSLRREPFRTAIAAALKLPAHVENWLSSTQRKKRIWHFAGGWEVVLKRL